MKIKVTARKYEGDDQYSWAVFRSDSDVPCYTGLGKRDVPHYKKLVQEIITKEQPSRVNLPIDCIKATAVIDKILVSKKYRLSGLEQEALNFALSVLTHEGEKHSCTGSSCVVCAERIDW